MKDSHVPLMQTEACSHLANHIYDVFFFNSHEEERLTFTLALAHGKENLDMRNSN
jgi:hypothetical protein